MADNTLYISRVHLPDGNTYELKDLEARDLIATLSHLGLSFVRSTNAANTPAGISWVDGSTVITGTLEPSSEIAHIYLVPDTDIPNAGEGTSHYIEYVCIIVGRDEHDKDVFAWEALGSTDARLDNLGEMSKANTASAAGVTFTGHTGIINSSGTFTAEGTVSKPAVDVTAPIATFSAGSLPTKAADTFTQGTLPSKAADTWSAGALPSKAADTFDAGSLPSKEADTFDAGTLPSFTYGAFSAGSLPSKGADTFSAGTLPTKAADTFVAPSLTASVAEGTETLTISFSAGSFQEGAFTQGTLPSFTEGAFNPGTLPSKEEDVFNAGTLPSYTEGTFDAGDLPSFTEGTFSAGSLPSFTEGAFSAGTLPTFTEGTFTQGSLPAFKDKDNATVSQVVMGVTAELHEAPTFTGTAGQTVEVSSVGNDISTSGNVTVTPDAR